LGEREKRSLKREQQRQRPTGGICMSKTQKDEVGDVTRARVKQDLISHTESLRQLKYHLSILAALGFKFRVSHFLGRCSYLLSHSTSPFL
jgi:hypothetical protein